jgi:hypothetical protein
MNKRSLTFDDLPEALFRIRNVFYDLRLTSFTNYRELKTNSQEQKQGVRKDRWNTTKYPNGF